MQVADWLIPIGAALLGSLLGGVVLAYLDDLKMKREVAVRVIEYLFIVEERLHDFRLSLRAWTSARGEVIGIPRPEVVQQQFTSAAEDFALSTQLAIAYGQDSNEVRLLAEIFRHFREAFSLLSDGRARNASQVDSAFDQIFAHEVEPRIHNLRQLFLSKATLQGRLESLVEPFEDRLHSP